MTRTIDVMLHQSGVQDGGTALAIIAGKSSCTGR